MLEGPITALPVSLILHAPSTVVGWQHGPVATDHDMMSYKQDMKPKNVIFFKDLTFELKLLILDLSHDRPQLGEYVVGDHGEVQKPSCYKADASAPWRARGTTVPRLQGITEPLPLSRTKGGSSRLKSVLDGRCDCNSMRVLCNVGHVSITTTRPSLLLQSSQSFHAKGVKR